MSAQAMRSLQNGLLYGSINAILAVPGLIGYAAVIFAAPEFSSNSAILAKAVS